MPKVISGVAGAKAFATEGTVQNIPDVTNRQGAKKALEIAVGKALDARKEPTPAVAEPVKAPETVGQKPPEAAPPAQESAEDPNEGVDPADLDLAERARKAIARKHRELKKAEANLGKLQTDLSDSENFSKAQYARAAAAEERVEALQRELEGLKAKAPEPPKPAANPKPDPQDKQFYDEKGQFKLAEYTEAVGKWSAAEAIASEKAREAKEREEAQARAMEEARQKAFETAKKRTAEQSKLYPDWDQVVPGTPIQLHSLVGAYMQASPHIGHIGYYLAKHPEYVEQLNKMNPLDAIGELGELCIRWKSKTSQKEPEKVKEEIKPPAPITTLPGIGATGVATDPSKMTPAQLRAYDRERALAKKRA